MKKWEYEVLALDWDSGNNAWKASGMLEYTSPTLTEAFNRLGEAGWEMVTMTPSGVLTQRPAGDAWEALHYRAIFKRRKP